MPGAEFYMAVTLLLVSCAPLVRETPIDFLIDIGSPPTPKIIETTQNGTKNRNCITLLIKLQRLQSIC